MSLSTPTNRRNDKEHDDIPEYCFLQVSIAGTPAKNRIVIELFREKVPKTCRNFAFLCDNNNTGERTRRQSPRATYRGCEFHRIIEGFMVQGGDFERFDGTGGYSPIYPGGRFPDESFDVRHDRPGIVSMANAGRNTNKSQFFITLKSTPHLDGKHVAFGKVVGGMDTVAEMLSVEREGNHKDRPVSLQRVVVTDCGVLSDAEKDKNKTKQREDDESSISSSSSEDSRRRRKRRRRRQEQKEKRRHKRKHKHKHRHQKHRRSCSSSDDHSESSNEKHGYRRHRKRKNNSDDESSGSSSYDEETKHRKKKHKKKKSYDSSNEETYSSRKSRKDRKKHKKKEIKI